MEIEELIAGKTISKALNEQLTHNEIRWNVNDIWSLLYMTGYLTIAQKPSGGNYPLRIPNREVRQIFTQQVLEWFNDKARGNGQTVRLVRSIRNGRRCGHHGFPE